MNSNLTDNNLDFLIKNNLNLLLVGKHGVGKTAIVKEAFERNNLKSKYFSAATMDPWVDFIGIPRVVKDNDKNILEMVLPKDFSDDTVEALFFDEFNRSPAKVRNAVMELIQFKSINGRKFNNLKVVWAAINPYTDNKEYDVERLDPALEDRFHVKIDVPYAPSKSFFVKNYGLSGSAAVAWWGEQGHKVQDLVTPRRLEYALKLYKAKGNVSQVFDAAVNVKSFVKAIKNVDFFRNIETITNDKDTEAAKKLLHSVNVVDTVENLILNPPPWFGKANKKSFKSFWFPLLPKPKVFSMLSKNPELRSFCADLDFSELEKIQRNTIINETIQDAITSIGDNNEKWRKFAKVVGEIYLTPEFLSNLENCNKVITALEMLSARSHNGSFKTNINTKRYVSKAEVERADTFKKLIYLVDKYFPIEAKQRFKRIYPIPEAVSHLCV